RDFHVTGVQTCALPICELAPAGLAGWWQVTLEFLSILTDHWPRILEERGQCNPAAHRSALMRLEAERLLRERPPGPVIAAGSTEIGRASWRQREVLSIV